MARWELTHYEALREAIATGAAEIAFKDKRIRYQGTGVMKRLLAEMERDLGLQEAGANAPKRARTPKFNNGL